MEFEILERKFKFVDDELYSFYKRSRNHTERWYLVKLSLSKDGYKKFSFKIEGKSKNFKYHRVVYLANNPDWDILDKSRENLIDHIDNDKTNNHISNLRVVSNQENQFNRKAKGYKEGQYLTYINY